MWTYSQSSGQLTDSNGNVVATGYSGHGDGVNNPSMQSIPNEGPIPTGSYTIGSPHTPIDHLGPVALPLYPDPVNEMFGRFGFFMHGDLPFVNGQSTKQASDGCIIMPMNIRQSVFDSGDTSLVVIA